MITLSSFYCNAVFRKEKGLKCIKGDFRKMGIECRVQCGLCHIMSDFIKYLTTISMKVQERESSFLHTYSITKAIIPFSDSERGVKYIVMNWVSLSVRLVVLLLALFLFKYIITHWTANVIQLKPFYLITLEQLNLIVLWNRL